MTAPRKTVVHLMRTYGFYGGEHQLQRLLEVPKDGFREVFLTVYRDPDFEREFQASPALVASLLPVRIRPRRRLWMEFVLLLALAPLLWIALVRRLREYDAQLCIAHGFQAGFISAPVAACSRKRLFAYCHRSVKQLRARFFFRLLYRPFNRLIGVSEAVVESLRAIVDRDDILVIPNCAAIESGGGGRHIRQRTVCFGFAHPARVVGDLFIRDGAVLAHLTEKADDS